jgi:hypothetical protein
VKLYYKRGDFDTKEDAIKAVRRRKVMSESEQYARELRTRTISCPIVKVIVVTTSEAVNKTK